VASGQVLVGGQVSVGRHWMKQLAFGLLMTEPAPVTSLSCSSRRVSRLMFRRFVVLIFFIGRKIANSRIGILAALLYLIFPMTLAFSHSAMSEISGSALSVALLAAYFLMPESWAKGLVLALFLGFGYLIKPLALSFVLPMACLAWFSKDPRKKRTFLVFASSFLLLYLAVLKPLTSNREYYPFAANDIFLQAGLFGKVKAAWANIKVNESQLLLFRWTSGEGLTLLAILLLCAVPCWWVAGSKATTDAEQAPIQQAKSLLWITLFAALQSFSAIFIFYEFKIWRGTRGMAFFAPLLCLLFSIGFFHWVKSSTASRATLKRFSALILAVGMLVFLGFSSRVVFQETQRAQRRDFYYFNLWAERLRVFVQLHSLRPKVVASYRNFFYPVRNYPITLIWTLPSNLKDLATIDERLPIDLLELSETDPLFLDNKKSAGDIQKMGEHFTLLGQENGFYYYGRQP